MPIELIHFRYNQGGLIPAMAKRPANLIYGVDDRPPLSTLLLLGVQHIFLMSSTLVLPLVLVSEIGGSFNQVQGVVALTMVASGIGTIVQAFRWGVLGSGYLCPNLCGPNFFIASMEAAWLGGLPLMRGMTIAAGLVEAVFARVIHRLRSLFPPEITGLVVLMVAVGIIPLGASKSLGINYEGEPIRGVNLLVAALTVLIMVGINFRDRSRLKLYSVLVGHGLRLFALRRGRVADRGPVRACAFVSLGCPAALQRHVFLGFPLVPAADFCHRLYHRGPKILRQFDYVRKGERR